MKFRKLLLCMLAGIFLAGFANVYTYAAEEDQNVTAITTATQETADSNITNVTDNTTEVVTDTTTEVQEETETTDLTATDAAVTEGQTEVADKETAAETKASTKTTTKAATKKTTAKATTTKKAAEKKEIVNYTKAELRLLSALIYCEAGGESYNGKLAVGIVVMNRVRASAFPDTVKAVIYQKYQFGPVTNGALNKALAEYDAGKFTSQNEKECLKAAKEALNGTKSITVSGKTKKFGSYLFFSGRLRGYTYKLGNHQFK